MGNDYRFLSYGEPDSTARLRELIDRVGVEESLSEEIRFDLQLAATEALVNAIKHRQEDPIRILVRRGDGRIEVEIDNKGSFKPDPMGDVEGGRGIQLMIALLDEVTFAADGKETGVRLVKRTPAPGATSRRD